MRRRAILIMLITCLTLITCSASRADDARGVGEPDPAGSPLPTQSATRQPTLPSSLRPAATSVPLRLGDRGALVALLQQRLAWMGYRIRMDETLLDTYGTSTRKAVRRYQVKFGIKPSGITGPGTWTRLLRDSWQVLPTPCRRKGKAICIDKTGRVLRYVENGVVRLTLDARFGMPGMPTAEGTFRVLVKSRNHTSSRYHTWMPFALFFWRGQAVHYSPYFARDGYQGASHGCVNLRDFRHAEWLFDQVPLGTTVHIYRSA